MSRVGGETFGRNRICCRIYGPILQPPKQTNGIPAMKNPATSTIAVLARFATLLLAGIFLGGCASTTPPVSFTQRISPEAAVIAADSISAAVAPAAGVSILDVARQRLVERIVERIRATAGAGTRSGRKYEIAVVLTRYEKGSAFARAMVAGAGQIHVDGQVSVFQLPGRSKVTEFTASKTFASEVTASTDSGLVGLPEKWIFVP